MREAAPDAGTEAEAMILCVVGPTASGKTALAMKLALAHQAEIVSCDSGAVYRGMDLGTAKPTASERATVPHHGIDLADPEEPMNAARWVGAADAAIVAIRARGRRVIVCGGTGLWLRALLHGLAPTPPTDPALRAALLVRAAAEGAAALHAELARRDPATAARLSPNDRQRVLRALEHLAQAGPGGAPLAKLHDAHGWRERRHRSTILLIDPDRADLFARIDARVDAMIAAGLVDEVRGLRARQQAHGMAPGALATVLGYRHVLEHLEGGQPLADAIVRLRRDTRRFAKRQLTWFRAMSDARVVPPEDPEEVARAAFAPR